MIFRETPPPRSGHRLAPSIALSCLILLQTMNCGAAESSEIAPARNAQGAMQTFLNQWNAAIAAQDQQAIRATYVSDSRFQWFEDGALRYRSADEILGALGRFPPGTRIETKLSDVAAHELTDRLMHGSAKFQTRMILPDGQFEFDGVFTMLLERTEKGWKFLGGHTSTRRPETAR